MTDALASLQAALVFVPPLVLLWLAFFFGRTLRRGEMPLIERIARRSDPSLSPPLTRYTRRLTGVWCVYFVCAAFVTAAANWLQAFGLGPIHLGVWAGTALLFVGERWLRPLFFPGEAFPGLVQQLRDTLSIWRPR